MVIAVVGGGSASGHAVTTISIPAYASTAGNIIVAIVCTDAAQTVTTPTDTAGSIFSLQTTVTNTVKCDIWTATAVGNASNVVTATFPSCTAILCVEEYSGAVGGVGTNGTNTGTGTSTTTALTPTTTGDWIVGGAGSDPNNTFTATGNNVLDRKSSSSTGSPKSSGWLGHNGTTTGGVSVTLTGTASVSVTWAAVAIILLLVAASGPSWAVLGTTMPLLGVGR